MSNSYAVASFLPNWGRKRPGYEAIVDYKNQSSHLQWKSFQQLLHIYPQFNLFWSMLVLVSNTDPLSTLSLEEGLGTRLTWLWLLGHRCTTGRKERWKLKRRRNEGCRWSENGKGTDYWVSRQGRGRGICNLSANGEGVNWQLVGVACRQSLFTNSQKSLHKFSQITNKHTRKKNSQFLISRLGLAS